MYLPCINVLYIFTNHKDNSEPEVEQLLAAPKPKPHQYDVAEPAAAAQNEEPVSESPAATEEPSVEPVSEQPSSDEPTSAASEESKHDHEAEQAAEEHDRKAAREQRAMRLGKIMVLLKPLYFKYTCKRDPPLSIYILYLQFFF